MLNEQVLLHIGYHKTGTTWLQKTLFRCVEAGFCNAWPDREEINRQLVLAKPLQWNADAAAAHFRPELEATVRRSLIPVLSHERLSGNPHSGGYDSALIAERLSTIFPNGRILLVIREQQSMIRSIYAQYVRMGGPASFKRYLRPPVYSEARIPLFDWDFLAYDLLIRHYQRLFRTENVLVLPFELLLRDSTTFVNRIIEFAGARPVSEISMDRRNVALSMLSLALKRRLNLVCIRDALNNGAPIDWLPMNGALIRLFEFLDRSGLRALSEPLKRRQGQTLLRLTGDRYRDSNRRAGKLIAYDLAEYGYQT